MFLSYLLYILVSLVLGSKGIVWKDENMMKLKF